jgi:hypothetical protein
MLVIFSDYISKGINYVKKVLNVYSN